MRRLKIIITFLCFMGCQGDPGQKNQVPVTKQIINESVTDIYTPAVDILFIIDNSGSMSDIQELLSRNAQLFIDEFLDTELIDYHIAVATSTAGSPSSPGPMRRGISYNGPKDGELTVCKNLADKTGYNYLNYVDRNTPRANECLKEMMEVGDDSQTNEQFFNIPDLVLSRQNPSEKSPFYRHHAHLAIFIITDSFDQSKITAKDFYYFLLNLKGDNEQKLHYAAGIVTLPLPQYKCVSERSGLPPGFIELAKLLGNRSYIFNICQFDFGKDMARFASHLVDSTLVTPLNSIPDIPTLEVWYNYKGGSQLIPKGPEGWSYNTKNNTIHLSRDIELEKTGGRFDIRYEKFHRSKF